MIIAVWIIGLAAITLVGILAGKAVKSQTAWTGADHTLGALDIAFVLAAWQIGGYAVVGTAQSGYLQGMSFIWYYPSCCVYLLFIGLMAGFIRKYIHTGNIAEYMGTHFGTGNRRVYSIIWVLFAWFIYIPYQLITMTSIVQIVLPSLPRAAAMLIGLLIPLSYTIFSGIRGTAKVGRIVNIGMYAMLIIFTVIALRKMGGYNAVIAASSLGETAGKLDQLPMSRIISWMLGAIIGTSVMQASLQPIMAAKTPAAATKGAFLSYFIAAPVTIFTCLIGVMATAANVDLGGGETAFAWTINNFASPVFAGVILAFATMIISATMQTMMLASGTIMTDIYHSEINKSATEEQLLHFSKIAVPICGLISVAFTLVMPSTQIATTGTSIQHCVTAPISFSILGGMFWKRCTKQGPFWSMVSGMLAGGLWMIFGNDTAIQALYPSFIVSYAVGIIVSLATSNPDGSPKVRAAAQ